VLEEPEVAVVAQCAADAVVAVEPQEAEEASVPVVEVVAAVASVDPVASQEEAPVDLAVAEEEAPHVVVVASAVEDKNEKGMLCLWSCVVLTAFYRLPVYSTSCRWHLPGLRWSKNFFKHIPSRWKTASFKLTTNLCDLRCQKTNARMSNCNSVLPYDCCCAEDVLKLNCITQ
jgi:hypothetical protein